MSQPKKAKDTDYLALSARIHVLETRLLNRERQERMLDAREDAEALRVLSECGYPELSDAGADSLEEALAAAQDELFADLRGAMPQEHVLETFQVKYDYHNAKALVKAEAVGTDPERLMVPGGRFDPKALMENFRKGELGSYPDVFRKAVQEARELLAASKDPQRVDFLLDRACYAEMADEAGKSGSEFLSGYVARTVDALNLRAAVRGRRNGQSPQLLREAMLPGGTVNGETLATVRGEELSKLFQSGALAEAVHLGEGLLVPPGGDMTAFERACDDAVTDYVGRALRVPFGVETVIGYLHARQNEMTAIRTIFSGRLAGLDRDVIRERLREAYG